MTHQGSFYCPFEKLAIFPVLKSTIDKGPSDHFPVTISKIKVKVMYLKVIST